jgi:hypothetical protein
MAWVPIAAAKRSYDAVKRAQEAGVYLGKCSVCGKECKASGDPRHTFSCAGCYQSFHENTCGLPHVCNKCLDTLPPAEKEKLARDMCVLKRRGNNVMWALIVPAAILAGSIFIIGSIPLILLGLVLAILALAIGNSIFGKMRTQAHTTFDAHPVPGVKRWKEATIDCPVCKRPTKESDGFVCMACSIKVCPYCGEGNKGIMASRCDKCGKSFLASYPRSVQNQPIANDRESKEDLVFTKERAVMCPICNRIVRESSGFICTKCSNKICTHCGAANQKTMAVCVQCGGGI